MRNDLQDIDLVLQVEIAGGLIKEEDPRFLHQCPGNSHFLQFPAAHLIDVREAQVIHGEAAEDRIHDLQVPFGDVPADVGPPADQDGIECGEPPGLHPLRNIADPAGELQGVKATEVVVTEIDRPALRPEDPVQALEEGGLAHAVRPEDGDDFPGFNGAGDILEHLLVPVHEPEFFNREVHLRYPLTSR